MPQPDGKRSAQLGQAVLSVFARYPDFHDSIRERSRGRLLVVENLKPDAGPGVLDTALVLALESLVNSTADKVSEPGTGTPTIQLMLTERLQAWESVFMQARKQGGRILDPQLEELRKGRLPPALSEEVLPDLIRKNLRDEIQLCKGDQEKELSVIRRVLVQILAPIAENTEASIKKAKSEPFAVSGRRLLRDIRSLSNPAHFTLPPRQGKTIAEMLHAFNEFRSTIPEANAKKLETVLDKFTGLSFVSFAERREFAKELRDILRSVGCKVQCTSCGKPALVHAKNKGPTGIFQYTHGSTPSHGGFTDLPQFTVVKAPPLKLPT